MAVKQGDCALSWAMIETFEDARNHLDYMGETSYDWLAEAAKKAVDLYRNGEYVREALGASRVLLVLAHPELGRS